MKIIMVCPAPPDSRGGNRVTANRWSSLLLKEGHQVVVTQDWHGQPCDVLMALHARKSYAAVRRYRQEKPSGPLIVALTGTDLYRDIPRSQQARQAIRWADRLIGLHDAVDRALPKEAQAKLHMILQSVEMIAPRPTRSKRTFDVCVLGHLRYEKDPLRAAWALRRLPLLDSIRIIQAGKALSPQYAKWAEAATRQDARYQWVGEVSRMRALGLLVSSRLMVISSRMEGGANVVSEAIVNGVPILASEIPGNVGVLGAAYRGYFPVADAKALAKLLEKACCDKRYYLELQKSIARLTPQFQPQHEQAKLASLFRELER
jgi:putative glycosyltransferase (TIGR04348 family)